MTLYFVNDLFVRIQRVLKIWQVVITLLINLYWDSFKWTYIGGYSIEKLRKRQEIRAKWLTKKLLDLGSAFIKIGQLLSARPDVLPANWIIELANLQDKVPPFNFSKVHLILKNELGRNCNEILDIEKKPLGAASLAQVHLAKLKNGRQVVFKVQRPGLQKLFKLDLDVLQQVAYVLQCNPNWSNGRNWTEMAKECKRVLLRELDFRIEAQYAARFRQQFLEDQSIKIPGVLWELSTEKVLCLDYLPGIKINNVQAIKEKGINPSNIAQIAAASYLQQLVRFGFFHADPHPGNLAVSNDGALIYYDFGMMGLISNSLRSRIGSMVRAAASNDAAELVKEFKAAGLIAQEVDEGPVRRLVRIMLKEALTPPFDSSILEKLSGDIYDLMYGKPFRLPVELIFVMRALSTFEGVGRSLNPKFNLFDIAKPYLLPLMTSGNPNPNDLINELSRQLGSFSTKAVGLPKRLDESLERLEQGDLQLQIRMGESDRQLRRMVNAQQAMGQSILISSLLVISTYLITTNHQKLAIIPIALSFPIIIGWLKLQFKLARDSKIEKMHSKN